MSHSRNSPYACMCGWRVSRGVSHRGGVLQGGRHQQRLLTEQQLAMLQALCCPQATPLARYLPEVGRGVVGAPGNKEQQGRLSGSRGCRGWGRGAVGAHANMCMEGTSTVQLLWPGAVHEG
jgi:hypothetical protein